MAIASEYKGYHIVTAHPKELDGSLDQLPNLFRESMGEKIGKNPFVTKIASGDFNSWLWKNAGLNQDSIISLAFSGDSNVGYCSIIPTEGIYNNKRIACGLMNDNLVLPQHRRNGILGKMHTDSYSMALSEGISVLYGFPNNRNPYSRIGSGTKFSEQLTEGGLLDCRLFKLSFMEKQGLAQSSAAYEVIYSGNYSSGFQDKLEDIGDLCNTSFKEGFLIAKSPEYLKWRYIDNPLNPGAYSILALTDKGKLSGICVTKLYEADGHMQGHILEMIGKEEDERLLILHGESYLKNQGAKSCSFAVSSSTIYNTSIRLGYQTSALSFSGVIGAITDDAKKIFDPVYFLAGDIDVF